MVAHIPSTFGAFYKLLLTPFWKPTAPIMKYLLSTYPFLSQKDHEDQRKKIIMALKRQSSHRKWQTLFSTGCRLVQVQCNGEDRQAWVKSQAITCCVLQQNFSCPRWKDLSWGNLLCWDWNLWYWDFSYSVPNMIRCSNSHQVHHRRFPGHGQWPERTSRPP